MSSVYNDTEVRERYEMYREQGYHMPYYEPFDVQEYYANALWVLTLKQFFRATIGTGWVLMFYCSLMTCIKLTQMIYQQNKYDKIYKQWKEEVQLYEDEEIIRNVNIHYKQLLMKYEERIERYNIGNPKDIQRYYASLVVVLIMTVVVLKFDFTRQCLTEGLILSSVLIFIIVVYNHIYRPIRAKIALKLEIRRLNKIIAASLLNDKKLQ